MDTKRLDGLLHDIAYYYPGIASGIIHDANRELAALKSRLAEAEKAMTEILAVEDGTTDGDAFTTSEGCYACDEKDQIARKFLEAK